jgi:outer membrane lipoprotein carrier protein
MKKLNSVLLVVAGFIMLAPNGWAASAFTDADLMEKIDARYAQTQDLQAEFTQETKIEGFETGFTSSGRFYLKKPGLLRWDYLQPSTEQIYVDGDQVLMYVPEHQQVVKGTLTQMAASKGPLALLQGVGKLSQQFTIQESSESSNSDAKLPSLTLVPKPVGNEAPTIKKIVLQLFPDSYLIKAITLFEVSGNISHVLFDQIQVNKGLSNSLLKFDIPPDVVVVDMPTFQ